MDKMAETNRTLGNDVVLTVLLESQSTPEATMSLMLLGGGLALLFVVMAGAIRAPRVE